MYPEEVVAPMRQETIDIGFQELRTAKDVSDALEGATGTALVFINSVCGCAAGMARPGLAIALSNSEHKPDHLYTVFAGNDSQATAAVRDYFIGYPPSSPCMGLLKDGSLVSIIQRYDVEGHSADQVAGALTKIFSEHCG